MNTPITARILCLVACVGPVVGCSLPAWKNQLPFAAAHQEPIPSPTPVANTSQANTSQANTSQANTSQVNPAEATRRAAAPLQHASLTEGAAYPPHAAVQTTGHFAPASGANFQGYGCPPGMNCPPGPQGQPGGFAGRWGCGPAGHAPGQGYQQGCFGTAAPCYPQMPPLASFGLDPQEFLCDGGDQSPRAVYTVEDRIAGVDLEDTVVKYENGAGDIHVVPSNRVCIYAPRFAAVRRVSGAVTDELATGPVAYLRADGTSDILADQPSSAVMGPIGPQRQELARGPDAVRLRELGVPIDRVQGPMLAQEILAAMVNLSLLKDGVLRDADKPWIAKGADAALVWSVGLAPEVMASELRAVVLSRDQAAEGLTTYELPNGRLRVIKVADRPTAAVGDIVTFVLRIDNLGDGPVAKVELTDNLTTRLEYVAESQSCSKGAIFSTTDNDGGSLRLTWKFTDDFKVGEGAIIRFRCRVR